MRTIRISLLAALLVAAVAVAQQPGQQPQQPAQQQTGNQYQTHGQYEPPSSGGAGQQLLAQFVGNWTFVDTFYPGAGGTPRVTKGTCKQAMIQGGKFLESDFTWLKADGSLDHTGMGLSGFDPRTNKFTTLWIDAQRPVMSIRQSDGTFDGKTIVLISTALDPDQPGRKTIARAHLENDGNTLVYGHYLVNADGQEREMFEIRLTRQQ